MVTLMPSNRLSHKCDLPVKVTLMPSIAFSWSDVGPAINRPNNSYLLSSHVYRRYSGTQNVRSNTHRSIKFLPPHVFAHPMQYACLSAQLPDLNFSSVPYAANIHISTIIYISSYVQKNIIRSICGTELSS